MKVYFFICCEEVFVGGLVIFEIIVQCVVERTGIGDLCDIVRMECMTRWKLLKHCSSFPQVG